MGQVSFRNDRGLRLAADLDTCGSRAVVVLAHGFTSDRASRGRFVRLAAALVGAGFDALRFDFGGCGESDDDRISMATEDDDLRAALRFVKGCGYERIGLYGHSLGGTICLRGFTPDIPAIVASGAATDAMAYDWTTFYTPAQLRELDEKGYLTEDRDRARAVRVDGQMLRDFASIDQAALLSRVTCPVLLVHGDDPDDGEEAALRARSERGMAYLAPGSRLAIVKGGHSLTASWDEVMRLAIDWYARTLRAP